ncbi:MAG: hypothetical protein U0941_00605 [Planctomycetaceae bacterium]
MTEKMPEATKSWLDPIYLQAEPNQEIKLGLQDVLVVDSGEVCSCEVSMIFVPDKKLHLRAIPDQNHDAASVRLFKRFVDGGNKPLKLSLPNRGVEFDAWDIGTNSYGGSTFTTRISVVTVTRSTNDIKRVIVHLFNFPNFNSSTDYSLNVGGSYRECGKLHLVGGDWKITLVAIEQTDALCKSLEERGGHVVTHVAEIERSDGTTFSTDAAEKLLMGLQYFLSFALGRWAGVAFPVGYSESGETVFEQWGLPMLSEGAWRGGGSWFDVRHGEVLAEAFPGFLKQWGIQLWHDAIRECLYWYVAANERGTGVGIDTGLILCQTALERLAWTYCVKDRRMVSGQAFAAHGGLKAADKIRLLITSLGIPSAIPTSLDDLAKPPKHIKGGNWDDAPHALTEIRNSIIHPDAKLEPTHGAYVDAWKMSLWLIELCVLRLIGFNGCYGNRLKRRRWAGEVEPVPWSDVATP